MFERILVPLDGSARAERAIPVAARLTRASGGVVVLLRVGGFSSVAAGQCGRARCALCARAGPPVA